MATGKLKIDIRRQAILEQLNREGQVFVTALSEKLGITPVTIRNDLDTLALEGRLERIQGGAIRKLARADTANTAGGFIPLQTEKHAIAESVLDYISNGDTLFINSGMTTFAVAEMLSRRKKLNIVTNSLAVANYLSRQPDTRLILLGGELNANYGSYDAEALLSMRYVLSTVCVNAQSWATRRDKNSKKYKKIADKTRFWVDAITYKLTKELGYTGDMIDDAEEKIDAEMRPQED